VYVQRILADQNNGRDVIKLVLLYEFTINAYSVRRTFDDVVFVAEYLV